MKLTLSDEYRETMAIDAPNDFIPTKLNIYKGKEGEETLVGVYKLELYGQYPEKS